MPESPAVGSGWQTAKLRGRESTGVYACACRLGRCGAAATLGGASVLCPPPAPGPGALMLVLSIGALCSPCPPQPDRSPPRAPVPQLGGGLSADQLVREQLDEPKRGARTHIPSWFERGAARGRRLRCVRVHLRPHMPQIRARCTWRGAARPLGQGRAATQEARC